MNDLFMMILLYISFIVTSIILIFIPFLTRKTELFGNTVPAYTAHEGSVRKMKKEYTFILSLITIFLLIILVFSQVKFTSNFFIGAFIVSVILQLCLSFILYLYFHKQVKEMKTVFGWTSKMSKRRIIDTNFHQADLVISFKWQLIPFFILLGTIIYTFMMYDQIPNKIITHIGPNDAVTYSEKSFGTVSLLPIFQFFIFLVFCAVHYSIKISKQEGNKAKHKQFRKLWSINLIFMSAMIALLFFCLQISLVIHQELIDYLSVTILFIIGISLITVLVLSLITGQSGSLLSDEADLDFDDDEYWLLGQFYFNKHDPTLFIEKRFGIGWTVNLARPLVWLIFIAIVGFPFIIMFFI